MQGLLRVEHMRRFLKALRAFILRGQLVELAVAFVVGVALVDLVMAGVADVMTPIIAAIFGSHDFPNLTFTIHNSTFRYGHFVNALITFTSIVAAVFLVVEPIERMRAGMSRGEEPDAETSEIQLLREIRDALVARS